MEGFTLLLFCLALLNNIAATTSGDTFDTTQPINDGQIIVSAGERFALGFFSPGNSKNRYVGIWYHKIPTRTVVWVANRDNPLTDSSGVLKINETGILVLLNHNKSVIWSSNSTRSAQYPVAKLLDSGNLIVQDSSKNDPKDLLWQSFDYPVDTILAGQKFGRNLKTGLNWYLSSWNSSDDPSLGKYNYQLDTGGYPQFVLREGTVKRFRFGSWNGIQFSGAPQLKQNAMYGFNFVSNEEEMYYIFKPIIKSALLRLVLTTDGHIQRLYWSVEKNGWSGYSSLPVDDCDYYEKCGAFSSCNVNNLPMCDCLDGFVHNTTDIYKDCVRRTSLSCHGDGFLTFSGLKLPDTERSWFDRNISLEDCRMLCMKNCSCTAYAALDISKGASGCLLWFDKLNDIKELPASDEDIYIRMAGSELGVRLSSILKVFLLPLFFFFYPVASHCFPPTPPPPKKLHFLKAIERERSHKSNIRKQKTVIISCASGILILCLTFIIYRWQKTRQRDRRMEDDQERDTNAIIEHGEEDLELPLFDKSTITFATNNFSTDNKLGEGGFGSVYKGVLDDGREIAVKRLSKNSRQGLQEFKNEVTHIAKLQHRNLVKLLGYCIQAGERLLVYEFMPNKSLDFFIFDEEKGMSLDWPRRLQIINGIARGLLYLHQDSRHRIVHRDLKAANVLLDSEMNPKISDFGLARSFGGNEIVANTDHVVGTYGYLPPEYLIDGTYSTKSDVFSFGVLILEIVSGKRNRGFYHKDNLVAQAWRLFKEGKWSEIVDAKIRASLNLSAVLRSIHVGLLCVQLSPDYRPSMSSVVLMLSSESTLPQPKMPGFFPESDMVGDSSSSSSYKPCSNDITVSQMHGR